MVVRFGRVIFWIGCIAAAIVVLGTAWEITFYPSARGQAEVIVFRGALAAIMFGAGRAVLYVLSGE